MSFFLVFLLLLLSLHSTKRDGGGEDRGIVGGSPAAAPRRLEVVVAQPVRFFELTPAVRVIAESAGARGGPGQFQIGRHSNVGAGSGTGTRRSIIVQWHSHRRPAASAGAGRPPSEGRPSSGVPSDSRGPSFACVFPQMSNTGDLRQHRRGSFGMSSSNKPTVP